MLCCIAMLHCCLLFHELVVVTSLAITVVLQLMYWAQQSMWLNACCGGLVCEDCGCAPWWINIFRSMYLIMWAHNLINLRHGNISLWNLGSLLWPFPLVSYPWQHQSLWSTCCWWAASCWSIFWYELTTWMINICCCCCCAAAAADDAAAVCNRFCLLINVPQWHL